MGIACHGRTASRNLIKGDFKSLRKSVSVEDSVTLIFLIWWIRILKTFIMSKGIKSSGFVKNEYGHLLKRKRHDVTSAEWDVISMLDITISPLLLGLVLVHEVTVIRRPLN